MEHSKGKEQSPHSLKSMSTEQLKMLLAQLEEEHDILQAKNEQMTNQISDLRNAVKCVQAERKQSVTFQLLKKKELQDKVDSLERGLKQAIKNKHYEAMIGFKALSE